MKNKNTGINPKKGGWKKQVNIILVVLLVLGVLALGFGGYTFINAINNKPVVDTPIADGDKTDNDNDESVPSSYEIAPPDADAYFKNNATAIAEFDINDSNEVRTETETYNNFVDRGFTENPITTEYAMDGKYYEATEISDSSTSKHPIYQTYYVSANGDIWTILEINGTIIANPLSYNDQSGLDVSVVISESTTITSYDSTTNKFYETIPNASALIVKTVSRIDAETLESLTFGGIDAL